VKTLGKMVSSSYHKFPHAIHVRINSFKNVKIVSFSTESFSFDSAFPADTTSQTFQIPSTHSTAPSETQGVAFRRSNHRNTIPINGRLPHSSEIMNFPKASNPLICHSALGVVSPRAHADLSSRVCVVADDIDDYLRSRFAIPRMTDWRKGH
jgi:hypothetical protein